MNGSLAAAAATVLTGSHTEAAGAGAEGAAASAVNGEAAAGCGAGANGEAALTSGAGAVSKGLAVKGAVAASNPKSSFASATWKGESADFRFSGSFTCFEASGLPGKGGGSSTTVNGEAWRAGAANGFGSGASANGDFCPVVPGFGNESNMPLEVLMTERGVGVGGDSPGRTIGTRKANLTGMSR